MEHELLVTAGVGPIEVRRFVARLADALAERLPVLARTTVGPEGAPSSVVLLVDGDAGGCWLGTHTLHERSARGRGRWFASVTALPPLPAAPALDPRDVRITACRAGGPGGQAVNTTSSAVSALHVPTGVRVRAEDERSQHRNRALALARLAVALARAAEAEAGEARRERWLERRRVVRGAAAWRWRAAPDGRLVEAP